MFSIIIVNWNGEKFLQKCFDSLINQTYKDFKIYFVDNGSEDNSIDIVKNYSYKLDIDVIRLDKNVGFAKANNIGIDKAMNDTNKYIITLNNDTELHYNCLENLVNTISNNLKYDIYQLLMINYFDRNLIDAAGLSFDKRLYVNQKGYKCPISKIEEFSEEIQGACAGAAAYSKESLLRVKDKFGYFDSNFFAYFEDVDLALRLLKKGYKTLLVKDSIVYHVHSGTGQQNSTFKTYYLTRNLLLYLQKNNEIKTFKKVKYRYYISVIRNIYRFFIKGDLKNCIYAIKGFRDYFKIKKLYS